MFVKEVLEAIFKKRNLPVLCPQLKFNNISLKRNKKSNHFLLMRVELLI